MIRTVILDDEELSTIYLEKKLHSFPMVNIIKTYNSYDHILEDLYEEEIDVIFLDIEMGSLNGLEVAKSILASFPSIHIVFITAHAKYAVNAFEINSIDYLLKPVTTKRLQITIERLTDILRNKIHNDTHNDEKNQKPLHIKCFNELRVYQGKQLISFKTKKAKELFGFLLTHINQFIHKDIIIENIWPDQDYQKAKIYLHTCLSYLRKMLEALGFPDCIYFSNQSYSLELRPIYCDAINLDKQLEDVNTLTNQNKNFIIDLIEQYTGPYMDVDQYSWAKERAKYYHEKILFVYDRLIEILEQNDPEKAFFYLQRRLKLDPYSDITVQKSINLLIQCGYRSKAISLYRDYKNLLNNDLGIEPDQTLINLYHSLTKVD